MNVDTGRKACVARIALFATLLVLGHLAFRHAYWYWLGEDAPSLAAERLIAQENAPCALLFLGNSHTLTAVDIKADPSFRMCATLGEPYAVTYHKVRYLLETRSKKPGAIALQLDLNSFADHRVETTTTYRWAPYLHYTEMASLRGDPVGLMQDWVVYKAFPYAGKSTEVIQRFTGLGESPLERLLRVAGNPEDWVRAPEAAAAQVAGNHLMNRNWNEPESIHFLERLVTLCEEQDVRFVWIRYPVTKYYQDEAAKLLPLAEWESYVESVCAAHPQIVYLDYHDALFERGELFADPNHLNAAGKAWMTQRVSDDLRALGVIGEKTSATEVGSST